MPCWDIAIKISLCPKLIDCHVKCFEEKCRCRAYQIWQKRCELLDEDRFSAPKDFVNDAEYTYFDMNREFANLVRQTLKLLMIFTLF